MPFDSKAQMRYLYATEPKIAKRFTEEMKKQHASFKDLPEKVGMGKAKMKKRRKGAM
jgi:hypothetical protein